MKKKLCFCLGGVCTKNMRKISIFAILTGIMIVSVISCSSDHRDSLIGKWLVISYADPFKATMGATMVPSTENYRLMFDENGYFSFSTDCNTVSGVYRQSDKQIRFSNLSVTEMACENEIVERSVKSQLPNVEAFDLSGDSILCLLSSSGNVLFKLKKASTAD